MKRANESLRRATSSTASGVQADSSVAPEGRDSGSGAGLSLCMGSDGRQKRTGFLAPDPAKGGPVRA